MKRLITIVLSGVCALVLGSKAMAISIGLQPNAPSIPVGGNAAVNIVISGLPSPGSPSLGAFLFTLAYDPSVVSANSVTFGNSLDLGILGSLQFLDLSVSGIINLDETSFETPGDLNANQPGTFTLATLGFIGVAPGTSPLTFAFADLSDENGASISGFGTVGGELTVAQAPTVPDITPTWLLLALGLLSLSVLKPKINTPL